MFAELASTENVSSCGVRVRTELLWKPNTRVFVKPSNGKAWARARVAYCHRLAGKSHAVGLEFYGTAHRYNLTFRCVRCGKYEASANFRSERVDEHELKARIYRVQCAGCGWTGEACGFSAVRILRYQSKETYGARGKSQFVRSAVRATR
jgi:Pyruvate/2-oxoacid:ferredoxin oxidoreductase delta subunit